MTKILIKQGANENGRFNSRTTASPPDEGGDDYLYEDPIARAFDDLRSWLESKAEIEKEQAAQRGQEASV